MDDLDLPPDRANLFEMLLRCKRLLLQVRAMQASLRQRQLESFASLGFVEGERTTGTARTRESRKIQVLLVGQAPFGPALGVFVLLAPVVGA